MFKRVSALRGPPLLNAALKVDWRQHMPKEDAMYQGKRRMANIRGDGETPSAELPEVNELLRTFVMCNDLEHVTALVKYAREDLGVPLSPFHYNCMLRVFAHHRDKQNVDKLLEVMRERGAFDDETYHVVVLALHHCGARDRLQQALAVVRSMDAAAVPIAVVYEEPGTAIHHAPNPAHDGHHAEEHGHGEQQGDAAEHGQEHQHDEEFGAMADDAFEDDGFADEPEAAAHDATAANDAASAHSEAAVEAVPEHAKAAGFHAPVLTALLYSVANSQDGPLAAVIVAFWIRALGAELGQWDYTSLLTALQRDVDHFPALQAALSPVVERTLEGGEPVPTLPDGCITLAEVKAGVERAFAAGNLFGTALEAARAVVGACESSLRANGVSATAPVYLGFAGAGRPLATGECPVRLVVEEMHRRCSIGAERRSPVPVLHHTALVHTLLRNRIAAVDTIGTVWDYYRQWRERYGADEAERKSKAMVLNGHGALPAEVPADERRLQQPDTQVTVEGSEGYGLSHWCVKDIANFFGEVPLVVRERTADHFTATLEEMKPGLSRSDRHICWALGMPLITTREDMLEAVDYVSGSSVDFRTQMRSVKQMIRSLITAVALFPPRGCKMSAADVADRRKWFSYYEARDAALTLFGQSRAGRDAMRELYENRNKLQAMRDHAAIVQDCRDVLAAFPFAGAPKADDAGTDALSTVTSNTVPRLTSPAVHAPHDPVPPHLYDPEVCNPYPHCRLQLPTKEGDLFAAQHTVLPGPEAQCSVDAVGDFFPVVEELLGKLGDPWWLGEPDTAMSLLKCYVHRLRWGDAVRLSEHIRSRQSFTAAMDGDIVKMFDEIGDPAGAVCFKIAAKYVDGRIKPSDERRQKTRLGGQQANAL